MMDFSTLLSLMLTGASTGLTCGVTCGACGNPMVNVFLASYLFTHTDRMKKSLIAFAGYHIGKAITVSLLCMMISWFGNQIVDAQGNFFGLNLHGIVYVLMLVFVIVLIIRWIRDFANKDHSKCVENCQSHKEIKNSFASMFVYGAVSGMSPCTSLLMILSYASALSVGEAVLVGLSFSLANSLIPLVLLTALTGLLSEQMYKEIPTKIRYFQLAAYLLFACVLIKNLLSMI